MADDKIVVLFFDDERFFAEVHIAALEDSGVEVHYVRKADDVIPTLKKHAEIDAMILDVMAPAPCGISDTVANEGLDTGLLVLEQVWKHEEHSPRPTLFLTNRIAQYVEDRAREIGVPSCLVDVRTKLSTPSFFLPKHVRSFIARAKSDFERAVEKKECALCERSSSPPACPYLDLEFTSSPCRYRP